MILAPWRSRPRISVVLSLLGLAAVIWTAVSWVNSTEVRYQKFPFIYRHIFGYEGTIDLAVLGPSREATMLDGQLLSNLLMARREKPVVVVDLGREFPGIDLEYIVMRDLLAHRKVSNLAMELSIPYADPTHVWTHRVGTIGDIVESYMVRRDISLLRRIQQAGVGIALKLAGDLSLLLQGDIRNLDPDRVSPATTLDISGPGVSTPEKLLALHRERQLSGPIETEMRATSPRFAQYMHYLGKVVELARAHDVKLILFKAERYASRPLDRAFVESVRFRFDLPVLQMHETGVAGMHISNYVDSRHANYRGRRTWTHWFADVLPPLR